LLRMCLLWPLTSQAALRLQEMGQLESGCLGLLWAALAALVVVQPQAGAVEMVQHMELVVVVAAALVSPVKVAVVAMAVRLMLASLRGDP
jgi:hypothetical protein